MSPSRASRPPATRAYYENAVRDPESVSERVVSAT